MPEAKVSSLSFITVRKRKSAGENGSPYLSSDKFSDREKIELKKTERQADRTLMEICRVLQ